VSGLDFGKARAITAPNDMTKTKTKRDGRTQPSLDAESGHKAVVKLLPNKGADIKPVN